ncbi:cysteine hydrolase family protein [Oryzifoliimicrobium ureilyticus]|uniref:cysteine hydrolase family protein n=1 Tax=Oryzifoliimicrobium ureilyticus TaxID=3113724 RepID=UPI0030767804
MEEAWVHLCIDVQRMFAEDTPWHVPWMARVVPNIVAVADRHPEKTIFTRFVPPTNATAMSGSWRHYYEKWHVMTRDEMPSEHINLIAPLQDFVPPACIFDKMTYSPWVDGRLHATLVKRGIDAIVLTGGETEVCVLAAALGAIDLGYRIILLRDALCSGADETHDAILKVMEDRYSVQVSIMQTEEFLQMARPALSSS